MHCDWSNQNMDNIALLCIIKHETIHHTMMRKLYIGNKILYCTKHHWCRMAEARMALLLCAHGEEYVEQCFLVAQNCYFARATMKSFQFCLFMTLKKQWADLVCSLTHFFQMSESRCSLRFGVWYNGFRMRKRDPNRKQRDISNNIVIWLSTIL